MDAPVVIHQDEALIVIDKPPGWIVHTGAGTEEGNLVTDWLVRNYPEVTNTIWPDFDRIGIVHRLDKDTSGVMVIAAAPDVLARLQDQFKERQVKKLYDAVVWGVPDPETGTITTLIGRHPKHRQQQTVLPIASLGRNGREAVTNYAVCRELSLDHTACSVVDFRPETGRMHQLRVHAKYLGTPILGDPIYNTKATKRLAKSLGIQRQLLHAKSISFIHPLTANQVSYTAPHWPDMAKYID